MAICRIFTRVTPVGGTGRFLGLVLAVGEPPGHEARDECGSALFWSEPLAIEGVRRMAQALAKRLREAGDSVIATESARAAALRSSAE